MDVIEPGYFDSFLKVTSDRVFKALKTIHDDEEESVKEFYQKMGIIAVNCTVEQNKKDLIMFFFIKYQKFDFCSFKINEKGSEYSPKLYI